MWAEESLESPWRSCLGLGAPGALSLSWSHLALADNSQDKATVCPQLPQWGVGSCVPMPMVTGTKALCPLRYNHVFSAEL